ncbi:MAG: hypothetical protein HY542_02990 [Deltaproteobacteria bacterium]|nr:hypothetical protein [Deltaproteobacteria bacterium]
MESIQTSRFDLKTTLESGQLFRYRPHDSGFVVGQRDRLMFLRQHGDSIEFEGCSKETVTRFLGLDAPIDDILSRFRQEPPILAAAQKHPGIRILNQDPWECLIGFLCSSASNIPKIKRNMEGMANLFGKPASIHSFKGTTFPGPGEIDDLGKITSTGTGYRAEFIKQTNDIVDDGWLHRLRGLPYEEAKTRLMELPGVGTKIADCVLLFSLGFGEAFPVDVWIERAMHESYPYTKKLDKKRLERYGQKRFGDHAGYAQQYLYHWRRNLSTPSAPKSTKPTKKKFI